MGFFTILFKKVCENGRISSFTEKNSSRKVTALIYNKKTEIFFEKPLDKQ
jgi:hypothetical protein